MIQKYRNNANILVIDTQQYAGNFERQMCAYITGQYGDCGVGDSITNKHSSSIRQLKWWSNHIVQVSDDNGCYRPATIWSTEGWFNNGLGSHFKDMPENENIAVEKAIEFMKNYNRAQFDRVHHRIKTNSFETTPGGWTKKACKDFINKWDTDIERVSTLSKFPAYLSVAIFVDKLPPDEVWDEFIHRAHLFAKHKKEITDSKWDDELIKITGFRQIKATHQLKTVKTIKYLDVPMKRNDINQI